MYKHGEVIDDDIKEDNGNETFVNPSQIANIHDTSCEATNVDSKNKFNCDKCDYTAETNTKVEDHNQYHCFICCRLLPSKNHEKHRRSVQKHVINVFIIQIMTWWS